jgi:NAD(P)-dependent dehydrogenase (short-subunit alcohol dehydrogenase family)
MERKTASTRGWTDADIGDLAGSTAVVTGANSGIGFETALRLAAHGARVVLACRDRARGADSVGRITRAEPRASAEVRELDLADLSSVRQFAAGCLDEFDGIDILVNNAGVSGGLRLQTADGFERHLGTNHLGHFALTGLLLPGLLARPAARVVTVSSSVAAQARINHSDLHSQHRYRWIVAYAQSKLANLMFALELDRLARAGGVTLASIASHPGVADSQLMTDRYADWGRDRRPLDALLVSIQRTLGQPARKGAWPSLYAATYPGLGGGEYIGPGGLTHTRGRPAQVKIPPRALNQDTSRHLWETSAELTGVRFDALAQLRQA